MSDLVDLRVVAIGVVALVLALHEQSRTSWTNLTDALSQGPLAAAPCIQPVLPPMIDQAAAKKAPDQTGSVVRTVRHACP